MSSTLSHDAASNKTYPVHDMTAESAFMQRSVFPLHLHWDGSLPAPQLFLLAKQQGKMLVMPDRDAQDNPIPYACAADRIINCPEQLEELMHGLRTYKIMDVFSIPIQFMQKPEDIRSAALALCSYLKSEHTPYAEARFAPQYHTRDLSIDDVLHVAAEAFEEGKESTGVDVRLIVSIDRASHPDVGVMIAKAAIAANKKYPHIILGIDLACEETGNPPRKHYAAFKETFDTPVRRTVHAGEMCDTTTNLDNIYQSIDLLRAERLGHAIPLLQSPRLVEMVVEKDIAIESNPRCNQFFFGYDPRDLHLDELMYQGVCITLNPDDPAFIPDGSMHHNLLMMRNVYDKQKDEQRSDDFIDKTIENSIHAAWGLSAEQKMMYLTKVRQEAQEYRRARGTANTSGT